MWNMPRDGFRQLYDQIPGDKPSFEEVWRATGGNPKLLGELYRAKWDVEEVLRRLVDEKKIDVFVVSLSGLERELLRRAVDDPDSLITREGIPLMDKLIDLNLIVDAIPPRDSRFWAGEPRPRRTTSWG